MGHACIGSLVPTKLKYVLVAMLSIRFLQGKYRLIVIGKIGQYHILFSIRDKEYEYKNTVPAPLTDALN